MFTETQRLILGIWFTLSSSCLFFPFLANNFLPTDIAMSFIFSNIFSFSLLIGSINLLLEIVIIPFVIIKNKIKRRKELIRRTKESLVANDMIVEQSNIGITKDNDSIKENPSIKEAEKVIKESKIELNSLNHSTNSYLMERKNLLKKPLQKELKDTIAEENKLKDEIQTEMKNLSGTLEKLKALNKSLNESLDKNNKHITHTFNDELTRVYSKRNK